MLTENMFWSGSRTLALICYSGMNKISNRTLSIKPKSVWSKRPIQKQGPPYPHFVQIGDPVLRVKCDPVDPKDIKKDSIRNVISTMKYCLKRYDGVGISAPQIGVPLQIMMVHMTTSQLDRWTEEMQKLRLMEVIPMKIIINPQLSIVDSEQVSLSESCCSMHGFSALVPRYKKVSVTGLDENGEKITWNASGWAARIAQHEFDHLGGKMFVDKAYLESLTFDYWNIVNSRLGDFRLSFEGIKPGPRKWFTSGWFLKQGK